MSRQLTAAAADLSNAQLALFHRIAEVILNNPAGASAGNIASILIPEADDTTQLADEDVTRPLWNHRADEDVTRPLWNHLLANAPDRGRRLIDELNKIEKLVSGRLAGSEYGTGELIERREKRGLVKLTQLGEDLNKLAERLLAELQRHERWAAELRIAASEAASTYVFPDVMRDILDNVVDIKTKIRTGYFRPAMVQTKGELDRGEIDLAIAWNTYTEKRSMLVDAQEIAYSKATPCVIFHPLHDFGRWMSTARKQNRSSDEILSEALSHPIVFPGALKALADRFEQYHGDGRRLVRENLIPVESFPAVVNHVAMRVGIGLFPNWPGLLEKVKRETNLLHISLPKIAFSMNLVCFQYCARRHPASQKFIVALEEKLRHLNSQVQEATEWTRNASPTAFGDLLGKSPPENWDAYYINTGSGELLFPHWRKGEWKLKLPDHLTDQRGRCAGSYAMESLAKERQPSQYELEAEVGPNYLRVMSTRVGDGLTSDQKRPQFLCFQELYTRSNEWGTQDLLLLGFITHSHPGRPTVTPFAICPSSTTIDIRQIERMIECYSHAVLDKVPTKKSSS